MAQPKREPEESDNPVPELGKRIKIEPSEIFDEATQNDHVKTEIHMDDNVGGGCSGGEENTIQIKTYPSSPDIIPEQEFFDEIVTLEPKVRQLAKELHKYRNLMWERNGMESSHDLLPNGILFNLSYNPPATFEEMELRMKEWKENSLPLHETTIKNGKKLFYICIGEKTAGEIASRICRKCMKGHCVSFAKCEGKPLPGNQRLKHKAAKMGVGTRRSVMSAQVRRNRNRKNNERQKRKKLKKLEEISSDNHQLAQDVQAELNPNAEKSKEVANVALNAEGVLNYDRDVSTRSGSNFDNVPVEGRRLSLSQYRMLGDDKMKEHTNWTKPKRIFIDPGIAMPIIRSEIQETDAEIEEVEVDEDWKPKMLPFEDIPGFTCVEDQSNKSWPIPQKIKLGGSAETGSESTIVSETGGFPSNNPPQLIHQQLPPQQFHPSQYRRQFETEQEVQSHNGIREARYYRAGDRDRNRAEYDRRSSPDLSRSYVRGKGETPIGPTTTIAELTRSSSTDVIMIEPSRSFISNTRPKYTESAF